MEKWLQKAHTSVTNAHQGPGGAHLDIRGAAV